MVPAIIGGVIAAGSIASNLYNSYKNRKTAEDAYDSISDAASKAVSQNQSDINSYKSQLMDTYGQGASQYRDAIANFLNSDVYQNQGFSYGGNIEDFYDPAANQRVSAAMDAINSSAASGGNRFSSDYVNRVGAKQQAMASEEWEKAYNKLVSDRQQQMAAWQANSANAWNNYNAIQDRQKYAIDQYGNDRNQYMQGLGEATSATINNRLGGLQTQANVSGAMANSMQNQNAGGAFASALGPVAQFAGSYFGAGS